LQKATVSFVLTVCAIAWNISSPTGRILIKFGIWAFSSKIFHETSSLIKIRQEWQVLFMKTFSHL
jgi:hypothetical protein